MFVHYCASFNELANLILIRLVSTSPINVLFSSLDDLVSKITLLKNSLLSCLFLYEDMYISTSAFKKDYQDRFFNLLCSAYSKTVIPSVRIIFNYDWDPKTGVPTVNISKSEHLKKCRVPIDVILPLKRDHSSCDIATVLCHAVSDYLDSFQQAIIHLHDHFSGDSEKIKPYHHLLDSFLVTTFYPKVVHEEEEHAYRMEMHKKLNLPTEQPLLRRGQALHPVPYLNAWLGPNADLLVSPHESLKPPSGRGPFYIVRGRYTYKHYMQDQTDDKNWGCAYRSLQTLISWLMWQGEIKCGRLPSLKDIQTSLVRVGDKPKSFIGSRQWIGSLEVSYCVQEMYDVQCRIFPVSRGIDMSTVAVPQLAQHFAFGGGPVMVGGGQLAHTIIGVQLPTEFPLDSSEKPSPARYLILDPHFTGPSGRLPIVLDKAWCGWKESSFWKSDVHYNLCFLPPVRSGRV